MKKLLLAAAAVVALAGPALGSDLKPYAVAGNWEIDAAEKFCLATTHYSDIGHSVGFGISVSGSAKIIISNTRWNIPAGDYEIRAAVDDKATADFTAQAAGQGIFWEFVLNESNINILSKGHTLSVYIGGATFNYSLANSAAMLDSLLRCTAEKVAANPFIDEPKQAPVSSQSNPFKRL